MIRIDENSDFSNDVLDVNVKNDEIMKFVMIIIDHDHSNISKIDFDDKIHF